MAEQPLQFDDFSPLLAALCDGTLDADGFARLEHLLATDPEARKWYIAYMDLHGELCWDHLVGQGQGMDRSTPRDTGTGIKSFDETVVPSSVPFPTIFIHPEPVAQASIFSLNSPFGGMMFSYTMSVLFVCVGMLIGWVWKVSDSQQAADANNPLHAAQTTKESITSPRIVFVGRITGMDECAFSDDKNILPPPSSHAFVPLGRKYKLESGLMEITYDSGAKVLLEGPVTYEVESASGGYLSLGKLTAKIEKGDGRRETGDNSANQQSPSPLSPLPSPLFFVRTPTAIVTDLGTEFGVEFDKLGVTRSHVFIGSVTMQAASAEGKANGEPRLLRENESASVSLGKQGTNNVIREARGKATSTFVRIMPKRVPFKLFNTGKGLQQSEQDPHWQLVARSDDPNFRPRPAIVFFTEPWYVGPPNISQWISVSDQIMPSRTFFTFRTTFDLTGMRPNTAVLRGRFMADNRLQAIRLNGREIRVPKHGIGEFDRFHSFSASNGFVEGVNVLEFVVENSQSSTVQFVPDAPDTPSFVGLLVELNGSAVPMRPEPATTPIDLK